jgi:ribonuclease VapC
VIIDSSAVIAILQQQPAAAACAAAIERAAVRRMSAANYLEAAAIIDSGRSPIASRRFDDLIREAGIEIAPVTADQARAARDAYRDFGKGQGHKANLNLGDCFAYALARTSNEPLLFVGNDFTHTGIASALGDALPSESA